MVHGAEHTEQVLAHLLANLECQVFGALGGHGQNCGNNGHAVYDAGFLDERGLGTLHGLGLELLNALLHRVVFLDVFLDDGAQVFGIVEEGADSLDAVFEQIHHLFALAAGLGFDTADAGCHAAFADNLEHADASGAEGVDTATELAGGSEAYHSHLVAVFLTEEGDGSHLACLFERCVTVFVERQVLTDHIVHQTLHLAQFLVGHLLEVGEVEAQGVGAHE